MPDNFGDQREQKQAIKNFEKCLRPGGLLFIDHRNYDSIMETGSAPSKSIYYNVSKSSNFFIYSRSILNVIDIELDLYKINFYDIKYSI